MMHQHTYPKYREAIEKYEGKTVRLLSRADRGKIVSVHPTLITEDTGLVMLYVMPLSFQSKGRMQAWHSDKVEIVS